MTRLLLVRHGITDAVGRSLSGRLPGYRLNERGRQQAARVAEQLRREALAAVYTSPLERCRETAESIAALHGLSAEVRPGLTDIDFGEWSGRSVAELEERADFRRFNVLRSATRPPGGEHIAEVQARMVAELCGIRDRHPEVSVAVVSHCDPLRAAIGYFIGLPVDAMLRLELDVASVSELELGPDYVKLRSLNRSA